MSDYPTAEEEFEMQYGDELQMMDDDDLIETGNLSYNR